MTNTLLFYITSSSDTKTIVFFLFLTNSEVNGVKYIRMSNYMTVQPICGY